MPQVDFYVLEQQHLDSRLQFTCRLVGKILALQQTVTVLVEDTSSAEALDKMLWSYPPESFSPHVLIDSSIADKNGADIGNDNSPIIISIDAALSDSTKICINLRNQSPDNHSHLQRLVEIVCQEPSVLTTTREKYKFYRQQGYPLQSHPINSGSL